MNKFQSKKEQRLGETNYNNQGCKMTIIKYINSRNISVQFENGYIVDNKSYSSFKTGSIKNLYYPKIYNVGYIGKGKYNSRENGNKTLAYNTWLQMLRRCYDNKILNKRPSYKDCSVCNEWHNFQNFAKWFEENYYEINGECMQLDKDILIKGNKIYSPNTCVFVPQRINSLLIKSNKIRGKYPIGVSIDNKNNFRVFCNNKQEGYTYIGRYNTELEAFNAYKKYKESYVKQVADEYKDKIPKNLYDALYDYKVEITD